jgi:hypothetical protein
MGRFRRNKVKNFDSIGFHKELKKIKLKMKGEIDHIILPESTLSVTIPDGLSAQHREFLINLVAKYSGSKT